MNLRSNITMRQVDDCPTPNFWGRYKDHTIHCSRENENSDWYIWVYTPSGALAYDGYWKDSDGKSLNEAKLEAIRGAQI